MSLYLVRVHAAPPNTTVTMVHRAYEYEVEADSLREACEMVAHQPVRAEPPVKRNLGPGPGHREYVEPDRARFKAVADFTANDRASMARGIERAFEEVTERKLAAQRLGRDHALVRGRSTIEECVTCVDSWDDASVDHAAAFRSWVEGEWYDEVVDGRSWFHGLHGALDKAGLGGDDLRKLAEEAYWTAAREVVAVLEADRYAGRAGPR